VRRAVLEMTEKGSSKMRKWLAALLVAAAALALAACGSSNSGTSNGGGSSTSGSGGGKTYKLVLSNNYMGNEWRPQMENVAKFVANSARYKGKVDLEIQNADSTPTAQIASLQSIIRQKPDAILLDPASATALDPTVQQACSAGIKVISFDQAVDAPCATRVHLNYQNTAHDMVEFLAASMHGRGDILMDTGLAGLPLSAAWVAEWNSVLKNEYPNIHVVGTYMSQYAPGPELQAVSSLLSQHPRIDGILSGAYCTSDIKALQSAGRPAVPMTCLDVNGNEQACAKARLQCLFVGAPAWASGVAIETAVKVLDGQSVPRDVLTFDTNFVNNPQNVSFNHVMKFQPLTPGVNYYPSDSPSLITPITFGDYNMTPADVLGQ